MIGEKKIAADGGQGDARVMARKWGSGVATAGFTAVPNHLLSINQFLEKEKRLTPTELLTLFQILSSWWYADRLPFPSKTTIAKRLGLSPRQIQRALNGLEEKGLIRRIARYYENRGRASNSYDVSQVVEKVSDLAARNPTAFRRRSNIAA
jgi:predicted transcriptional regulator